MLFSFLIFLTLLSLSSLLSSVRCLHKICKSILLSTYQSIPITYSNRQKCSFTIISLSLITIASFNPGVYGEVSAKNMQTNIILNMLDHFHRFFHPGKSALPFRMRRSTTTTTTTKVDGTIRRVWIFRDWMCSPVSTRSHLAQGLPVCSR